MCAVVWSEATITYWLKKAARPRPAEGLATGLITLGEKNIFKSGVERSDNYLLVGKAARPGPPSGLLQG